MRRAAQEARRFQQFAGAVAFQRQRRKARAAQPPEQRAAFGNVAIGGRAFGGGIGLLEGGAIQAGVLRQAPQFGRVGDAPALDVMGPLQALQQVQATAAQ